MSFAFARPIVLILLIPLLAHLFFMARRLRLLSARRRAVAVGLRALVLTMMTLALAGLRVGRLSNELTVIFVIDDSESLPPAQRQYAHVYVQNALNEMKAVDEQKRAGIILFGSDAAIEHSPTDARPEFIDPQAIIDRSQTNIAEALQLAIASFSGKTQKRIVLVTDGNQNVGDAVEMARRAGASNVAIDTLALEYKNRNDVILEKVIVEPRVDLEESFDIQIIASSRTPTKARLSIRQDGRLIESSEVELEGEGRKTALVRATSVADTGFHTIEAQLDVDGDMIPQNNRGFAFTYVEGEPRVLLVEGGATANDVLIGMLRAEKVNVVPVDASGLPTTLRELQSYDAVIFDNIAAGEIMPTQMTMIEQAVEHLGIGFVMIGGENSFGAGGYNDSPIEKILPVEMELKNQKILPQGALVPIIHTVEIPEGQFWAEQIMLAALNVLSRRDLMGVLYYSWQGGERWLFPLQEVGNKARMRGMMSTTQWGDMPSYDKTLQMAFDALVDSGASTKHIVVISDGDAAPPSPMLADKIKAAKITISTVCINPHSPANATTMQNLAERGGGQFYNPKRMDELPQIFIREATTIRKSLLVEEPFTPVIADYSPMTVGLSEGYPQLLGYVGTSEKELADYPLKTHQGEPLLAHWRYGLGKTVAFTSDAKPRWADAWLDWESFSKFWSQVVNWARRTPFNRNYNVNVTIEGGKGKVIIDAVDQAGEFRNFLDIRGNVITPSNETSDVVLRQVSPGRYEGEFEANEPGTYMFGGEAGEVQSTEADFVTGGTSLSYSPEFHDSASNKALLIQIADLTKGRMLTGPAVDANQTAIAPTPVFVRPPTPAAANQEDFWPKLLFWMLILFLLDVFTRRVIVGWPEVQAGLKIARDWLAKKLIGEHALAGGPTDRLLQMKHRSRSEAEPIAPEAHEQFLASLKQVKTEGSPIATAKPRFEPTRGGPIVGAAPAAGSDRADDGSHTGQLLKARAKARQRMKRSPGEGDDAKHE